MGPITRTALRTFILSISEVRTVAKGLVPSVLAVGICNCSYRQRHHVALFFPGTRLRTGAIVRLCLKHSSIRIRTKSWPTDPWYGGSFGPGLRNDCFHPRTSMSSRILPRSLFPSCIDFRKKKHASSLPITSHTPSHAMTTNSSASGPVSPVRRRT